eukprot:scaffold139306_cov15-Tisochrysis_lutea.AAC.1
MLQAEWRKGEASSACKKWDKSPNERTVGCSRWPSTEAEVVACRLESACSTTWGSSTNRGINSNVLSCREACHAMRCVLLLPRSTLASV